MSPKVDIEEKNFLEEFRSKFGPKFKEEEIERFFPKKNFLPATFPKNQKYDSYIPVEILAGEYNA